MTVMTLHRDTTPQPAGLVWENPPSKTPTGAYAEVAAALRQNPGKWAVIRVVDKAHGKRAWNFSTAVRTGKYRDFRADEHGSFEGTARTVGDEVRIYARYVTNNLAGIGGNR